MILPDAWGVQPTFVPSAQPMLAEEAVIEKLIKQHLCKCCRLVLTACVVGLCPCACSMLSLPSVQLNVFHVVSSFFAESIHQNRKLSLYRPFVGIDELMYIFTLVHANAERCNFKV